jgi:hypothetical protein
MEIKDQRRVAGHGSVAVNCHGDSMETAPVAFARFSGELEISPMSNRHDMITSPRLQKSLHENRRCSGQECGSKAGLVDSEEGRVHFI